MRVSMKLMAIVALLGATPASAQEDWLDNMPAGMKHTTCAATNALLRASAGDLEHLSAIEDEGRRHIVEALNLGVTPEQLANVLIEIRNQLRDGTIELKTLEIWREQCLDI